MSTPAGDGNVGDATITVNANTDPALLALRGFSRDAQGRIRDVRGRFVADGTVITRSLTTAAGGGDRFGSSLRGLTAIAGSAAGALGRVSLSAGTIGAAAGGAVPIVAGLVAAVESILPASAVAASGALTLLVASSALKLGMIGVGDAIQSAFDPDVKPEELAKQLGRLAPNAREFVKELAGAKKGFTALQLDVQNRLFAGLADELESTAKSLLPSLERGLDSAASSFNTMAKEAASAARDLAASGVLGSAIRSSENSLRSLERVPGQAVSAFGKLAAAAGPSLERIATAAAGAADRVSESLSRAFESGALEDSISAAVDNIEQLGRIAGNIFGGLGNIIKGVSVDGQGLFGTLETITQAFEDLTASKEFQSALRQLSQTMSTLVSAVLPLVQEAFKALLPIIEILAPPLRELVRHLGEQLRPVIEKMGPVLADLAEAFVDLIPVLTPVIDLGLRLISAVLPILTPLFEHLSGVLEQWAPVIEQVADNIGAQLLPFLEELPGILDRVLPLFLELGERLMPLLLDALVELAPSLAEVGAAFAELLVELTPLIIKFLEFQIFLLDKMMPVIAPLAELIAKILVGALGALVIMIKDFVIPIIQTIVALLNGDWATAMQKASQVTLTLRDNASKAFENLKRIATGAIISLASSVISRFQGMASGSVDQVQRLVNGAIVRIAGLPGRAASALSDLSGRLRGRMTEAGIAMTSAIAAQVNNAVNKVKALPSRAQSALGNLGMLLYASGRSLIGGFISGILSRLSDVANAANSVLSKARNFFPDSPAKEGPFSGRGWVLYSGRAIGESLAQGLAQREEMVRRAAQMVAQTARQAVTGSTVTVPMAAGPLGMGAALGIGAARTNSGPGATVINVTQNFYLENHGVLGSRRELENWLAGTMDDLRLQGRLPMGAAA